MKTTRLLLPFLHGVHLPAIEQALRMAISMDATLVALVLLHVPRGRRSKGVRLDDIDQCNDFLEAVKCKAARFGVPVEHLEVTTEDAVQTINMIAAEMECDGIVLFMSRKEGILLPESVSVHLLLEATCKIYVVRLPSETHKMSQEGWRARISRLFGRRTEQAALSPDKGLADKIGVTIEV